MKLVISLTQCFALTIHFCVLCFLHHITESNVLCARIPKGINRFHLRLSDTTTNERQRDGVTWAGSLQWKREPPRLARRLINKKPLFEAHTVKLYLDHPKHILYSGSFSPCDVAVVAKILFISFLCSHTNNKLCDHKEMRYYSPGCGTQDPCMEYHFVSKENTVTYQYETF